MTSAAVPAAPLGVAAPTSGHSAGPPGPAALPGDAIVGIAELQVTAAPTARLVTYALGSCLGVAIHDPVARVSGLLHVMLPDSTIDPDKARTKPAMFVDTGVPMLFREAYRQGAEKARLVVKVAGGASAGPGGEDRFQIGKRNLVVLRKLLWKNGVLLHAQDVGGQNVPRTMSVSNATGDVVVRANGTATSL